jgi:hypothetical protein
MSPGQGLLALVTGVALVVLGAVWLFGPWALVASGVLISALALLVPVKERSAESAEEVVPPGT